MKFRNPHFVNPTAAAAATLAPKITTYLQGKPAKEFVGLARIKADVPEVGAATREVINAALQLLNIEIDEAGADNA